MALETGTDNQLTTERRYGRWEHSEDNPIICEQAEQAAN